jgi:hypothetical protein
MDGDSARLCGVLVLPVAALSDNAIPSVLLDDVDDITNLHRSANTTSLDARATDPNAGFSAILGQCTARTRDIVGTRRLGFPLRVCPYRDSLARDELHTKCAAWAPHDAAIT